MPDHQLTVDDASRGTRIDLFVGHALGLSRARVKQLFEDGAIRVNGRVAKKGLMVEPGQKVSVHVESEDPRPVPEPALPLRVLHEDEALVFLDKPSGWPSHPLRPGERGTLVNALVARYPECIDASEDPREGGLCHRIDTQTSGVLLAARTREAWLKMRDLFTGRTIDKRYWALVSGPLVDEGEIDVPLKHHGDRVDPSLDGDGAREALTRFRVLGRSGVYSLVEAQILTGVLHQVRAHLASIGAPIVGDAQYGGEELAGLSRFFLHARSLSFEHPTLNRWISVVAPLPEELRAALLRLGIPSPE